LLKVKGVAARADALSRHSEDLALWSLRLATPLGHERLVLKPVEFSKPAFELSDGDRLYPE